MSNNWKEDYRFLPCNCGGSDHNIIIHKFDWTDGTTEYTISATMRPTKGFFRRIATAFKYIFQLDVSQYYYTEVCLTPEQFKGISSLFDEEKGQSKS